MTKKGKGAKGGRHTQMLYAWVALLGVLAIVLLGCVLLFFAARAGMVKVAGDYSVSRLVAGSYSNDFECKGYVRPFRTFDVRTEVSGTIMDVRVKDGDYVRPGDVLFEVGNGKDQPTEVLAEMPGTVMNVNVQTGMSTEELESADYALQICDMNVLVGDMRVPEYAVSHIEKGQGVTAYAGDNPDTGYDGIVLSFDRRDGPDATYGGQTYYSMTVMFNDSRGLEVGMPIVAHIPIDDYGQVYYVPATAVKEDGDIAHVDIVYSNGIIEQHQVELLGTSDDGEKIIKGSVLTNETVIRADLSE